MKLQHALAQAVAAEGIGTIFGLVGGGNEEFLGALVRDHRVRYVAARHEQAAVGMADGFSRATGRIGVATISHGPGLSNGGTTMTAARIHGSRLLVIVSDTGVGGRLNNMNFDQPPFLKATIGAVQQIDGQRDLTEGVELAFRHIRAGKGPIAINIPQHVLDETLPDDWTYTPKGLRTVFAQAQPPNPQAVAQAAQMLRAAKRPVLLAGRGAVWSGAKDALLRLAERGGMALATTLMAKGWLREDAHHLGVSGGFNSPSALKLLHEADLVVAFGAALNQITASNGKLFANATIVQVDTNAAAINTITPVDLGILGDATLTAEALLEALGPGEPATWRGPDLAARIAELNQYEGVDFAAPAGFVSPHLVAKLADEALPKDRVLVVGLGQFMGIPGTHVSVSDPADLVLPWQFGAVGAGTPQAIGAAVGRPDRPTVLFEGDGGLMMGLTDLETAARIGARLVIFVMDDGGFGAERPRFRMRGVPLEIANYANPDLAKVAAALGLTTYSVRSEAELRLALAAIGTVTGPTLVHCRIHEDAPFPEMLRYSTGAI